MKKNLVFGLGGSHLESDGNPIKDNVVEFNEALQLIGHESIVCDRPSEEELSQLSFDHIWILQNPDIDKDILDSQMRFLSDYDGTLMPITLVVNDPFHPIEDQYQDVDYLQSLFFDKNISLLVDSENHDKQFALDTFVDKEIASFIPDERIHFVNWVTAIHWYDIMTKAKLAHQMILGDFEGLFVGDLSQGETVQSLTQLGINPLDLIIGDVKWIKKFPRVELAPMLPMDELKDYIYQAQKLYLPAGKLSGQQITKQLIEYIYFKSPSANIVADGSWDELLNDITKEKLEEIYGQALSEITKII